MTDTDRPLLATHERLPASGGEARQLVVMFHGVGGSSADMLPLVETWRQDLPDAAFLVPDGPHPFDMQPAPRSYQWFSVAGITRENRPGRVAAAASVVNAYLDAELARRKLDESRLALVGFSQGTILSLYVALRRKTAIAGVVGYSGRLADPDDCSRHIVSRPPVLLVHGDADPVIPLEDMKEAAHVLSAAGVPVETEVRSNLGHMLDTVSVACGLAFLKRRFADLG